MLFTYPLSLPTTVGPAKANLKKFDAIAQTIGVFSGVALEQQWADQHWELDLEWPQMTWAQFAALDAFAGALHGKYGSFLWGPPLAAAPLGSAGGTPVTSGTNASGSNTLVTTGWPASIAGVLAAGDFLQITAAGGLQRLYQNLTAANSDGSGNSTLTIFPSLREAPPSGTAIVVANAAGTFRLAENLRESPTEKTKTFTFSMKCREAI